MAAFSRASVPKELPHVQVAAAVIDGIVAGVNNGKRKAVGSSRHDLKFKIKPKSLAELAHAILAPCAVLLNRLGVVKPKTGVSLGRSVPKPDIFRPLVVFMPFSHDINEIVSHSGTMGAVRSSFIVCVTREGDIIIITLIWLDIDLRQLIIRLHARSGTIYSAYGHRIRGRRLCTHRHLECDAIAQGICRSAILHGRQIGLRRIPQSGDRRIICLIGMCLGQLRRARRRRKIRHPSPNGPEQDNGGDDVQKRAAASRYAAVAARKAEKESVFATTRHVAPRFVTTDHQRENNFLGRNSRIDLPPPRCTGHFAPSGARGATSSPGRNLRRHEYWKIYCSKSRPRQPSPEVRSP